MSGHSKWSTIKRQKGAADAKRGQAFTKLSNAITIAVKEGGGISDPETNFKLRLAIDRARAINMPKDTIERAINKAKGAGGESLMEVVYEGFAPQGIAVIVQAVTDNKARTVAEVKNVFDKNGGNLGSSGSVSYLFTHKGEVIVSKEEKSSDEIFSIAIEAGADDIEEEDGQIIVYTDPAQLNAARVALQENGLKVISSELVYKPNSFIEIIDKDQQDKIGNLLERLEDLDDVQKVYTNVDFKLN